MRVLRSVPSQASRHRDIIAVDAVTGEPVSRVLSLWEPAPRSAPRRRYITEDYLLMFSEALVAATDDKDLGQQEWRVFMRLVTMLHVGDGNTWKTINITDLGKALDIARPNVSAAIKTLVSKEYIIKGARVGRGHLYSLNANFGWKGPAAKWKAASDAAPRIKSRKKFAVIEGGKTDEKTPEQSLLEIDAPKLPGIAEM